VVLRNWDNLPDDYRLGEHSDLDLLVYDYDHFFEIFPKSQKVYSLPRVRTKIPIGNSFLYADIRYLGDDYYPLEFEKNILKSREKHPRGFYTPDYTHHTIALAYHAVHHKNSIAPEYRRHLGDSSVEELLSCLKESSVGWVLPKDHTVGRFNGYWKGATSIVQKENGFVYKKQTGYLSFPLLKNENDILKRLSGLSHFPSCRLNGDVLEIEDCGNPLTQKNVPSDWRDQIHNILNILNKYGVSHRDIKSDNLVCKDGVISLIDFGWSVTTEKRGGEFEGIENNPPSCLGFPNKPSYGFDDVYSMNRVEKQIEFMLEEESLCV
jgi:hypothetical protein